VLGGGVELQDNENPKLDDLAIFASWTMRCRVATRD
jgi:hypothetical protein